jgi:hypothetical protein
MIEVSAWHGSDTHDTDTRRIHTYTKETKNTGPCNGPNFANRSTHASQNLLETDGQ